MRSQNFKIFDGRSNKAATHEIFYGVNKINLLIILIIAYHDHNQDRYPIDFINLFMTYNNTTEKSIPPPNRNMLPYENLILPTLDRKFRGHGE